VLTFVVCLSCVGATSVHYHIILCLLRTLFVAEAHNRINTMSTPWAMNSGDQAFILLCSALVQIMTPGVAFFYVRDVMDQFLRRLDALRAGDSCAGWPGGRRGCAFHNDALAW
jgi:hypothetical protein